MVWSGATRRQFLQFNIDLLEEFFGPDWFRKNSQRKQNHPAFQRWLLSQQLRSARGRLPSDPFSLLRFMPAYARLLLDGMVLSQISGGDTSNFKLGTFANYGDVTVRRRIDSVKDHPTGFASLMSELSYAAWHQMKGHTVTAYDDVSQPDFKVAISRLPLPIIADRKHIGPGTSLARIRKVIGKANKQVKAIGEDGYGFAVIDLSDIEPIIRTEAGDDEPPPVRRAIAEAQKAMQCINRSISGAVVLWDESTILGLGKPDGTYIALRRCSLFIPHQNPRNSIASTAEIHPGFNVSFWVRPPRSR